ncbi:MAG: hypothetical protein KDK08_18045 [Rhizobiaceae bacterium]|nr:hypothetical protein [Rhizobiaceae bacterium]
MVDALGRQSKLIRLVLLDTGWIGTGAIMSAHYKQMQHGRGDAARLLNERLARNEMGDAAYDEAVSYSDDRAFKLFGIVFIVVFAAAVFGVALLA